MRPDNESKNQPKCNHQWKKVAGAGDEEALVTVCERCGASQKWPLPKTEKKPKDPRDLLTEG